MNTAQGRRKENGMNTLDQRIAYYRKAAKKAELFDVFRGSRLGVGKKSRAMHITFVPEGDKPITPENADAFFKKILSSLEKNFGASLR